MSSNSPKMKAAFDRALEQLRRNKNEGIASGWEKEDRENRADIEYRDEKALKQAAGRDKDWNKKKLNALKMGSHRMGRIRDEKKILVTDNIDWGTTKLKTVYKSGKNLVGYKEVDFLKNEDDVEWVVLSEIDYTTQLTPGLPAAKKKVRVMKTGGKIFMDPEVFVKLVKAQEDHNDVKLTITFDRGSATKRTGALNVIVFNPKNPDHHYGSGAKQDGDDNWTERYNRKTAISGTSQGKRGV